MILKVQVKIIERNRIGLERKVGIKNFYIFTLFKYCNISLNRDIFEVMHRYFQLLHRPISSSLLTDLTLNILFL